MDPVLTSIIIGCCVVIILGTNYISYWVGFQKAMHQRGLALMHGNRRSQKPQNKLKRYYNKSNKRNRAKH